MPGADNPTYRELLTHASDEALRRSMRGRYFPKWRWVAHCCLRHRRRVDIAYRPFLGLSHCEHGWHQR